MKKIARTLFFTVSIAAVSIAVSCDELAGETCAGCPDDAPYGTIDGGCYATLSECNDNESGNCVVCQ